MTNAEAIEVLKNPAKAKCFVLDKAISLAILALDKQVPKKAIKYSSVPHHRCPACRCAIRIFENDPFDVRCKFCGQAIDWEEV